MDILFRLCRAIEEARGNTVVILCPAASMPRVRNVVRRTWQIVDDTDQQKEPTVDVDEIAQNKSSATPMSWKQKVLAVALLLGGNAAGCGRVARLP